MASRAAGRRCDTRERAYARSVSSVKTMVTADTLVRDVDRTWVTPGRPAMASSTGRVTSCSTSSGASPGAFVRTCTCTLVMSGTASTGRST